MRLSTAQAHVHVGSCSIKPGQSFILSVVLAWAIALALPAFALDSGALPTGGTITGGTGSISQSGSSMIVNQATDKMVAEWSSFNIGTDASVVFVQPGTSSIALNRVQGESASQILGSLTANGQIFLINPSGIIFGSTATVDVGGLVASTLDLSNEDFLSGNYAFEGATGSIINNGDINGRYVAFISPVIENSGTITADNGTVLMAAGNKVSLDFTRDGLVSYTVDEEAIDALVENKGLIRADGGTVIMTAKAADDLTSAVVNNEGVIQARTLNSVGGRILLLSDMETGETVVGGTLDASAPNGGNGGFIETSAAKVTVSDSARITTAAPADQTGTWLIDPTSYTIAATGGDETGAALSGRLGSTNITIDTTGSGTGSGDIIVNDSITWTKNTLTLNAYRNIEINSTLYGSGTAGLALYYGQGASDGVISGTTASYSIRAPVNLASTGSFATKLGTGGTLKNYTIITSLGAAGSTTGTDLQGMQGNLSRNYVLGSDIVASATSSWNSNAGFAPVGNSSTNFTGIFDGLGHTITGLTINRSGTSYVGLFGYADNAYIRNVGLVGGSVTGAYHVGGLVGYNYSGSITNSYNTGSVSGGNFVGGLVGYNYSGSITNSYSTGLVSGEEQVGGLVGYNIIGSITNSYSTGSVTGLSYVGGLVGENDSGAVTGSFWDKETSGQTSSSGGTGKTTEEMQTLSTFSAWSIDDEGGTSSIWRIYDGYTYPLLRCFLKSATATVGSYTKVYDGTATLTGVSYTWSSGVDTGLIYGAAAYTAASASKNVGTYAVSLSGLYSDQQGYDIATANGSFTITPKNLTISGITASNKTYDGTTAATVDTSSAVYSGLISGDSLTVSATGLFSDKNAGTGKTVTLSSSYTGTDKGNYTIIDQSAATATINQASLTVTAAGYTKIYDGNAYTGGNGVTYSGFVGSETESVLSGTLSYEGTSQGAVNAGTYAITPYGLTSGNYAITFVNGALTVNRKSLTASYIGVDKVYDGTLTATVTGGSSDIITGDDVDFSETALFSDKNAGTGKTVSVSGIALSGTDAANYSLTGTTATTTADITAKSIAASYTGTDKVYDGTTAATVTGSSLGIISGDTVTISNTSAAFSDKNAGTDKTITVSGIGLSGTDALNYTLTWTTTTTTADITAKSITASYTGTDKTYDGTTAATVTGSSSGIISGDDVDFSETANFLSKNAGADKFISVTGITLSGDDAANYSLTGTTALTYATINQAALTVTASDYSKTYDGNSYSGGNGVAYSGFVGSEDSSVLSGRLLYAGTSQGAVNAGTYAITPTGLTSGNYNITYADGTLFIVAASSGDGGTTDDGSNGTGGTASMIAGIQSGVYGAWEGQDQWKKRKRTYFSMGTGTGSSAIEGYAGLELIDISGLTGGSGEDDRRE